MPECFCNYKSGFITTAVSDVRRTGEDEPGEDFLRVKKEKEEEEVEVEEEDIID